MVERPSSLRSDVPGDSDTARGERHATDQAGKVFIFYSTRDPSTLQRSVGEKTPLQELIGKSHVMQLLYRQIQEVAAIDATVLIEGETGTGKGLVARAIQFSSSRRSKPFVALNCAGLSDSLLGSQLFGHTRGAFAGALTDHRGFFEEANGGTLFLDEIGDMPLTVQTSLLRVLEKGEIVRLGESTPRKIDVRVLTATHHNLHDDATKGAFRADLLSRIRAARIQLPALRQHRDDIPLLAGSFLTQGRPTTGGSPTQRVSADAMRLLLAYPWPGNVREVKSAMAFATIRCKGSLIEPSHLPAEIVRAASLGHAAGELSHPDRPRILAAARLGNGNRPGRCTVALHR